jgi:hypothetical protein
MSLGLPRAYGQFWHSPRGVEKEED